MVSVIRMSGERNLPDIAVISPEGLSDPSDFSEPSVESLGLIMDPPNSEGWDLATDMGVFRPTPGSNVIVDDSPLQNQMERNKESLKVKLMVRRPFDTLVEQGIVPSPKTSPFLHEQRQKLERAKMGDMLRAKIAKRPDRQELVHRHILEDVPAGVDPSLCDKQRQLKRAKLADSLSNQLQLRPGPLELIQKNILHTDDTAVEQAVKEGQIQFRPTNDGLPFKQVELPDVYTVNSFDEDSSDGGLISPPSSVETVQKSESTDSVFPALVSKSGHERRSSDVSQFAVPSPPPCSLSASSSTSSKISSSTSSLSNHQAYSQRGAPGKERKIKKPKAKGTASTAKTRTIKFHEYKGPPSAALKRPNSEEADAKSAEDSRYELLLKQQQLFLQWQLELSHKYPQIILPAAPTSSSNVGTATMMAVGAESSVASSSTTKFNFVTQSSLAAKYQPQLSSGSSQGSIASVPSPATSAPPTPRANTPSRTLVIGFGSNPASSEDSARLLEKMEAMKVTDLKAELKKRNLPTSGPKSALIERLKPHLEAMVMANGGTLRLKLGGQSPSSRATSVGRTSKENSPMNIGSEGVAMDALSQPGTPLAFQEMTGSPSPMGFNSQDSNALTSPLRTIHSMEQHSPRSTMDLDHFDLDLMDTDRSQASPAPLPATTTVVTTSPIRTNNSKNTVLMNSQGSPTIITLPSATEMIPATLPTVLPKPMTIIPPPPPPPPPPSRRKACLLTTSTSKAPSFTITPVMSTMTTASTSTLAQSQLQILPMAQIHTTRSEPIVIQVPQAPKVLTTNGILSNLVPTTTPQLSVLPTSSAVQRDSSHDLIREQQRKIEELQSALQKSQSQLLEQAKILSQQQSQLNGANNNSPGAIPSPTCLAMREQNANHMKMLKAQQMQNNQLQNQIQQLQAMQMKVQEHEQQVNQTLTTVRQSTTQMTPPTQTSTSTSATSSSMGDEQREIRIVMDDGQHFILKKDMAQHLKWGGQETPNHVPAHQVSNHNQSQVLRQNLTNNGMISQSPHNIQYNTETRLNSHTNGTASTSTGVSQVAPKVKIEPKIESQDPLVEEMLRMLSSNNSTDLLRYGIAPPPPPPPYHHHSKPISVATPPLNDILAFDINDFELPALENIDFTHQVNNSHHQFNNDPVQSEGESSMMNGNSTDGMDVDQDVADWLDSLLPQNSVVNNITNGFTPTKINSTPEEELNGNVPPCWTMDSFNKGGSSNPDFGTSTHFLADDFLA
ncbi:myocardin-related transcription factor B-like isoform X2 [Tigriopus californicus]|uniref:myocardin-related transcription factor B-like isoform X2 n=1 Tax=Tigriopus californicus TaxID=6832 RepID=UPI0027DA6819|nr:myocardin-related transcription factor B-like isoform X2 [Tigriopus californicus]